MKKLVLSFLLMLNISCGHTPKPQKREFVENGVSRPVSSFDSSLIGYHLPNLHIVEQRDGRITALRGNMPHFDQDFAELRKLAVAKILIFKNDKNGEIQTEKDSLLKFGFSSKNIYHMDFDWKDNENFVSGCTKFLNAFELIKNAYHKKETLFFHCTTGEDRTGALSALYLKYRNPSYDIKFLFKNEMCKKGYEGAEYYKPKEVVAKIQSGLSLTFLKMYYAMDKYQKSGKKIDHSLCQYEFQNDPEFLVSEFSNSKKYNCANEEFKYAF